MKTYEVLENGHSISLNENEYQKVKHILYFCSECGFWHIDNEHTMDNINELLN